MCEARGAQRLYLRRPIRTVPPDGGFARKADAVSKQDTHFINVFSLVIGMLVAIAIGIFVLARAVGHTQDGRY